MPPPTDRAGSIGKSSSNAISSEANQRGHGGLNPSGDGEKAPPLTTSLQRLRSSSAVAAGVTHVAGYGHSQLPNDKREQAGHGIAEAVLNSLLILWVLSVSTLPVERLYHQIMGRHVSKFENSCINYKTGCIYISHAEIKLIPRPVLSPLIPGVKRWPVFWVAELQDHVWPNLPQYDRPR
jgi:hypothetical protein